jgi:hypothetical protein
MRISPCFIPLLLAACPASGGDSDPPDAPVDGSTAACADTSASPVDIDELHVEPCDLRGFTTASPSELAAAADGSLYIGVAGGIERYVPAATGCSYTRDTAFVSPAVQPASIEATSDGRVYYSYLDGNSAALAWLGSSTGECTTTTRYRKEIGASGDGVVVLAPAAGPGLHRLETSSCTIAPLAFVTDTPRVFGRADTDVIFGGPTGTGIGRYALDGTERYRITDRALGGREGATLEMLGARIASWAIGFVFSVDAATGDARPAISHDEFMSAIPTRDDATAALFDVAPDGQSAFVLAVAAGSGDCAVTPSLYRLTIR